MKKLILFTLLVGCLHTQHSLAQGTPAPSEIKATFKSIGLGVAASDIVIQQDKGYLPLVIELNGVSVKLFHYTGPATMPLLRKIKTSDKVTYVTAGEVIFPPIPAGETGDFLVVFSSGPAGRLTATPVRNDSTSFPPQTIRVINALSTTAGVMVNKDTNLLKSGEIKLFTTASAKDNRVEIHVAVQHGGKWVEVNNNLYICAKDVRQTIFLIDRSSRTASADQLPAVRFYELSERPEKPDPNALASASPHVAHE